MSPSRRTLLTTLALAALPSLALAQEWPGKQPIRIIVPFAAGGTSDILARTVGEKLQAALKLAKAHPAHEAQIATLNAPKAPKAKRKYMSDDKRTKLRDMLLAYQAGQPPNPMDLGEYIALL